MTDVESIIGEVALRRAAAVKLAVAHRTYEEIAQLLGYPSRQAAREDTMRGLRARKLEQDEDADTLVTQMVDECNEIAKRMRGIMRRHGVVVRGEAIVRLDGKPLVDEGPAMHAAAMLLRVQERLAKLKGLDAATKIDATVNGNMTVRYSYRGLDPEEV